MMALGNRLGQGVVQAIKLTPLMGALGVCFGYIYAKLADLPASQAAKAYAIWSIAQSAIDEIARSFAEKNSTKCLISASMMLISASFGIHEIRKRGLMGNKMVIFMMIVTAYSVISSLEDAADNISKGD